MNDLLLVGLNYRTAPLEIREKISFSEKGLDQYLHALQQVSGVNEGMILSTCNRVEIYAATANPEESGGKIKDFIARQHHVPSKSFGDMLYVLHGKDVVRHVLRVASSLDSMVVGEPQILGQIKEAYQTAHSNRTTGLVLNKLMRTALSVAKKVRSETSIGNRAVSVSFVAVELAKRIFGDLAEREVLIVGAGEMCELAGQHLVRGGIRKVLVTNRTWERAIELAERFHGEAVPFTDLSSALLRVDIVLSSTGSPDFILRKKEVGTIIKTRKNRPLFFIDVAVPRDIDPRVNTVDNVYLYDIDDLQEVAEANLKGRQQEAQKAEAIVSVEVEKFCRWSQSQNVIPVIVSLKDRFEGIREKELQKTLAALPGLSDKEKNALENLTAASKRFKEE